MVKLMPDPIDIANLSDAKPQRNWWKIAFFIAVIAFEFAREFAVLASAEGAQPNNYSHVFNYGGYVRAQGSWKRVDGGDPLVPGTVTIECQQETGRCLEASVMVNEEFVYAPEIDWFNAQFSRDAVTYENDIPNCVRYSVRIDLKLQKAFAVRERKNNPSNLNCANLERRIEMQLGDGFDPSRDSTKGHFVPFLRLIMALVN